MVIRYTRRAEDRQIRGSRGGGGEDGAASEGAHGGIEGPVRQRGGADAEERTGYVSQDDQGQDGARRCMGHRVT